MPILLYTKASIGYQLWVVGRRWRQLFKLIGRTYPVGAITDWVRSHFYKQEAN